MPKALCVLGAMIAILLLIVFGFDLIGAIPFGRVSYLMDLGFVFCAFVLGYVSWTTWMEQR
jgi:hypothetical protein